MVGKAVAGNIPHAKRNEQVRAERRLQAYQLRLAGLSYRRIGAEMHMDHKDVWDLVNEEMESRMAEPRERVRELELDRLDVMLVKVFERLGHGDISAVDRGLRIMERRAKLLGLDAPTVVENHNTDSVAEDAQLDEMIRRAREMAEAAEKARSGGVSDEP